MFARLLRRLSDDYYMTDRGSWLRPVERLVRRLLCLFDGHQSYAVWSWKHGHCGRCGKILTARK